MPTTIEMAEVSMSMADVDIATAAAAQKKMSSRTFVNSFSFGLSGAAALTAVLAMVLSGGTITYIAMSISLLLSSVATVQRIKLSRQETFREVMNQVRDEANRLQLENNSLTLHVNDLSTKVTRLDQAEAKLSEIVGSQNVQINTFVYEVKQNALVQQELQRLLEVQVTQSMLNALLAADRDGDFKIDPEEVDILLVRIKALPGVDRVDETRIRAKLLGSGMGAVVDVVRNLMDEQDDGSEKLVQVSTRGLTMPSQ